MTKQPRSPPPYGSQVAPSALITNVFCTRKCYGLSGDAVLKKFRRRWLSTGLWGLIRIVPVSWISNDYVDKGRLSLTSRPTTSMLHAFLGLFAFFVLFDLPVLLLERKRIPGPFFSGLPFILLYRSVILILPKILFGRALSSVSINWCLAMLSYHPMCLTVYCCLS